MIEETAIPIDHAQLVGIYEELSAVPQQTSDKTIADMASTPGWQQIKKLIEQEINRLREPEWNGETVEEYGFKCLACNLAKSKLTWIVNLVDETAKSVTK